MPYDVNWIQSSMPSAPVELKNVTKRYGAAKAVDNVSIRVNAGEFLTLLGPSGSGKTTMLKLIAGFETMDEGDLFIDERVANAVPSYRRNLGFVFQNYALFPHMSVEGNVLYPLQVRGWDPVLAKEKVGRTLDFVALGGLGQRVPHELSGGQQQRVALARALVYDPPILLMDEPLSALDRRLRQQMQFELLRMKRELGMTVIYVTHDQEEALAMSDRVAVINGGQVVQVSAPREIYEAPISNFVAEFIGETNLFDTVVTASDYDLTETRSVENIIFAVATASRREVGARMGIAIRPERMAVRRPEFHAALASPPASPNTVQGTVNEVVYIGSFRKYQLRIGERTLIAHQTNTADMCALAIGEPVHVSWRPEDIAIVGAG